MLALLRDFNLLISTFRRREEEACTEIWYLLELLGDPDSQVEPSRIPGLVLAKTSLSPFRVVEALQDIFRTSPEEFHYVLKVMPIEEVIDSDLEALASLGGRLESKIKPEETFRITVEKRYSHLDREKVIHTVAEKIDRKVDLKSPSKIVWLEILGPKTGVSVLRPDSLFSLERIRRELRDQKRER